jgi:hypothetical protein
MGKQFIFTRDNKRNKIIKIIFITIVCFFALIGFLFSGVFVAMQFNLTNVQGGIDSLSQHFNAISNDNSLRQSEAQQTVQYWATTPEWQVISAGFIKDKAIILKASQASGVSPRVILSSIIAEQFRFFTSNREIFKKYFQPLEILGNSTQFSYGIAGIKTGTAKTIEKNLKDPTSTYYPGPQYEHLLDFTTSNTDTERMNRLIDPNNYYYSYLYTGLLLKEEMTQWKNAGYPIDNRPEILATLFNLGFAHSNPNANPQTGGATVTINGQNYTFGGIAFDFYYSNELTQDFPN